MSEAPKFMHDCQSCVFLGHHEKHDLYFCPKEQTITARFDHDDSDCVIALAEEPVDPLLREAFIRACDRGLIRTDR